MPTPSLPAGPVLGLPDLPRDRCLVMGIVNVTPDSFSDGGEFLAAEKAIARGRSLLADGADLIDVGGESTRPGAQRVEVEEELRRILPVITELAADGAVVSVDTMRAAVAEKALAAGARIINDVSGGLADSRMPAFAAEVKAPYIAMHWRGHSDRMESFAHYEDVVADVRDELAARLDTLVAAGVDPGAVVVDPGLGFAKTAEHNWALLRHLDVLGSLGCPVLVGASRKRFLGQLLAAPDGTPAPPSRRDDATDAVTTLAAAAGVWAVRVHEARRSADAVRVAAAWAGAVS